MPRSGEAGAGRSKPAESSAQPPPPAAATHAAGRKEGPPATNRFLLPAAPALFVPREPAARGGGLAARRAALSSGAGRPGPAGREAHAAGTHAPLPAPLPLPRPEGHPPSGLNPFPAAGRAGPRTAPGNRARTPLRGAPVRPPAALSLLLLLAASDLAAPLPATPLRTGAARRLPPPRGAVASSRPTCPPARPLLRRSLLGLRRGGHFELPNSFAAAGETRGRGARAPGPPGGVGDGGVAAAGSEPRARGGLRTAGTAFCPGARGRRWRAKRRERAGEVRLCCCCCFVGCG